MTSTMNRRDFLRLLSLLPAAYYLPRTTLPASQTAPETNFIIFIFDSWTASNTSLYGYPRNTTPNIDRFAENAIVYHNHYAAGHYTYPSTASLLTSVLPWTHRGQLIGEKELKREFHTKNMFQLFESHNRYAYTNNQLADSILDHMSSGIDDHPPSYSLSLSNDPWYENIFRGDPDTSTVGWTRAMEKIDDGYAHSLFFSRIYEFYQKRFNRRMTEQYPRGVPELTPKLKFLLEDSIDWSIDQIKQQTSPALTYIHLLPPHDPYNTRLDFYNKFLNDGFQPLIKPYHPLAKSDVTHDDQIIYRQEYDEFLAFADSEFGRLMDQLKRGKSLDNTWFILTSDHGEMFERGLPNHEIPSFHQPLMHIPLIIVPPGQQERVDIFTYTSTIDILPTLLHLSQKPIPDWFEGEVLPPFSARDLNTRSLYSMDGRYSPIVGPYTDATIMLRKGALKFSYMYGTEYQYQQLNGEPFFELFNIEEDPEELNNLYHPDDPDSKELFEEMTTNMRENQVLPEDG